MSRNRPQAILGIGNDVVEIERIQEALDKYHDKFLKRLFTEKEIQKAWQFKNMAGHIAGRFAAKEAVAKALGVGFGNKLSWLDIEILNDDKGKPAVYLSSAAEELFQFPAIMLTISHSKTIASAVALYLS